MTMGKLGLAALVLAAWAVPPAAAETLSERANRGLVEVVTGSVYGSSARMAEDLADALDDGATRRILPVVGKGSLQDLVDLKVVRGIDLAIVQSDVLELVKAQKLLPGMDSGLTYVAKLYNEEFHLLARGNIGSVNDLAGKKVNFGGQGDGTAVTATRLFEALRVKVEPTAYGQALALEKLRSGEIAAMAFVAGKPAALFANLRAQDGLHFLAVPLKGEIASAYIPARLTAEDYPGLVTPQGAVDTVAVGTAMIAANLAPDSERYRNTANFVEAFFTQFSKLLEPPHHPKWSEVNLAAELPG
ncbi:MAG TPA: TAXI family TRAP transporter solute-binding subunit, partial [Stellaceae bacterium]